MYETMVTQIRALVMLAAVDAAERVYDSFSMVLREPALHRAGLDEK